MKKKKELIIILGSLLVVVLSVTLAYFTTEIFGSGKDISLDSANLKIIFSSGSGNISGVNIEPGWSSGTSTFTVKNESNGTYKYNIVIKDLINTFVTTGYLQYKITSTDGGYNMSDYADVPKSTAAKDKILAYSVEIAKGATHTYSVEFKYENNTTEDQSDDMGKKLSGTLYIEKGTEDPRSIYTQGTIGWQVMDDNPTIKTRTDFSTTYTETNTGTLFKSTESIAGSTAQDVYYFAGNAKNNWVKFGKYEKDIVRGYYSSTYPWHKEYTSIEECTSASRYNYNCSYAWHAGDDVYWRIIRTNHDGSIRLLYSGTSTDTTEGYIAFSSFSANEDPMYVGYMYGTSGTLASNRTNENDSTIKKHIDNWFSTNISSYSKYISTEAVYCNDREVGSGTYTTSFQYAAVTRLYTNKQPSYNCTNSKDAFSGSNAEAKLTYPVALMTADEVTYAGGVLDTNLTSPYTWYYLNSTGGSITGISYWYLLSPFSWDGHNASVWYVFGGTTSPGKIDADNPGNSNRIRPVTSLKSCVLWKSGDGSPENPYEIEETESGC